MWDIAAAVPGVEHVALLILSFIEKAIGRCAAQIREVQEVCMGGLMMLISNRSETVVAESVVVSERDNVSCVQDVNTSTFLWC